MSNNNKEYKYNFSDSKVNEYTLYLNNDLNYVLVPRHTGFCLKCLKEIDEGLFCDKDCKREYFAEIRRDQNGFED